MKYKTGIALTASIISIICMFALLVPSGKGAETNENSIKAIRIVHTNWSSSVATANLVKAVFEQRLGIRCRLEETDAESMWASVAKKNADAMVSAWLPDTQAHYYKQFKDRVINLGPNLEGTKTGLVVPDITLGRLTAGTGIRNRPYIDVDSIKGLRSKAENFNHRIIGIEPEAGIMRETRQAMQIYELEKDFRLVEGSEVAMLAELSNAIRHQKWIVVTGWLPHWMFARWKLKFLNDPEGVFGDKGHIATIVRKGLEKDMTKAYHFLDNFYWKPSDIGQLMLWIREDNGRYPYEKALRWLRYHPEKIDKWVE